MCFVHLSESDCAGRHACECEARRHRLINNCLKCGRVVCDQEGSGPRRHLGAQHGPFGVCLAAQLEHLLPLVLVDVVLGEGEGAVLAGVKVLRW